MRDKVLKDLNHRDPRCFLVGYGRLAAKPHDFRILIHAIDEDSQGRWVDPSVRIDHQALSDVRDSCK